MSSILGYAPSDMVGKRLGQFCAIVDEEASVENELRSVYANSTHKSSPALMSFSIVKANANVLVRLRSSAYAFCNPITLAFEFTICEHKVIDSVDLRAPHGQEFFMQQQIR